MANKIILIREGVISSWAKDGFTFGMLAALPIINHRFAGGSGWIYFCIALSWLIIVLSRASGVRKKAEMTPVEAKHWLDENFPEYRA